MRVTQVHLKKDGTTHMICWVPSHDYRPKKGDFVELKGYPEEVWEITDVFSTQDHQEINRKWDVGGL